MNSKKQSLFSFNIDSVLKVITFSTLIGIGVLLFTQHLIFSSTIDKMKLKRQIFYNGLHLTGDDTFLTKDFSNGQPFSGNLVGDVKISSAVTRPDPSQAKTVLIKLDANQNLSGIKDSSKCIIRGLAYVDPLSLDKVNITLQQLACKVNDVEEYYNIEGGIGDKIESMGLKAEIITANIAYINEIENLKKYLTDNNLKNMAEYRLTQYEEAPPVLVLPSNMRVNGLLLKNGDK